jgi:hypothetical protein
MEERGRRRKRENQERALGYLSLKINHERENSIQKTSLARSLSILF